MKYDLNSQAALCHTYFGKGAGTPHYLISPKADAGHPRELLDELGTQGKHDAS